MKNVMIVDDNCLTAEGIEKNIDWSALDATVIAVEYNSLSALDILKDTHVDLIISDIEMPDLDGISMSQKALEIQPFIKVILVSAYDKFEYAKRAIRLSAFVYMTISRNPWIIIILRKKSKMLLRISTVHKKIRSW